MNDQQKISNKPNKALMIIIIVAILVILLIAVSLIMAKSSKNFISQNMANNKNSQTTDSITGDNNDPILQEMRTRRAAEEQKFNAEQAARQQTATSTEQ